jgi:hypothetical protein
MMTLVLPQFDGPITKHLIVDGNKNYALHNLLALNQCFQYLVKFFVL